MLSKDVPSPLLNRLVQHYEELVHYVCRAAGVFQVDRHQVRDTAREAVHEVCLQLLKGEENGDEVKVPLAFLRTLSKRRAIDNLRRDIAWRKFAGSIEEQPNVLEMPASEASEPEHRHAVRQQLQALSQSIDSLPPRCRDVFVLHKIHEWPQAEVAQHLGISLKTVEKHLRIGVTCCRFALQSVL